MLNEKSLGKILELEIPHAHIRDIYWKSQDSDENGILFYKIGESEKSKEDFKQRIAKARFGWLVVNKQHENLPSNCSVIDESRWLKIQKDILDILYPLPHLKLIALTGTNGKTTTTDLVLKLGEMCGFKGMSIGTLGVREKGRTLLDFGLTSPSYIDLRKFLNIYGHDKDFCVLEASSHALIQHRLYQLQFDGAGWLSFSQDHLDYHKTMEEYFEAKCLIFFQMKKNSKLFVPKEQSDLLKQLSLKNKETTEAQEINEALPIFFKTKFNKNNLEVAVSIVEDVFKVKVPHRFDELTPPDGRFYIKPYKSNYIVVDFAHTPDALDNICKGIQESFPNHRFKILFGCGGDRDRTKRPLMGKIADKYADEIYLTSDNPRGEDPSQIIEDIKEGIHHKKCQIIVERPLAVKVAFSEIGTNEVLLLAGKGHEDYILIKGVKHPYSDIHEVDDFVKRNSSDKT